MEIIKAIAMLCSIASGDSAKVTQALQINCHSYYSKCLEGIDIREDAATLAILRCQKNVKASGRSDYEMIGAK